MRVTPRTQNGLRALSLLLLLTAVALLLRSLPLEAALARLEGEVGALGGLGLAAYGVAYVLAALALVPGAALTGGAGALFGPLRGLVVVSFSSTAAAALAFLIARHLARRRVEALVRSDPRFRAVDRAVAAGGWKVVALLRLSPAMPFSIENYLFGLTAVRFGPYLLATWVSMLPGTFLYVSLGHAGRAVASGGARTAGEWALLGVGLLATAALTAYLTRLARRSGSHTAPESEPAQAPPPDPGHAQRPGRVAWRVPAAAAAALAAALWAHANADRVRYVLGPPPVSAAEVYASTPAGRVFDHSRFDGLLRAHVDADGMVNYAALKRAESRLDGYLDALAVPPFDDLGRDERLALLLNAYNAFTLRLVLDHWPLASIRDIPAERRWDDPRWRLAGEALSLNQIEHERIRPRFREPRVHFALVCAADGCPPLRAEAYTGARLESQLADQARRVHSSARWLRYDDASDTLHLTELYKWYESDFLQGAGSLSESVAVHAPAVRAALAAGRRVEVRWIPYDWSLNEKR